MSDYCEICETWMKIGDNSPLHEATNKHIKLDRDPARPTPYNALIGQITLSNKTYDLRGYSYARLHVEYKFEKPQMIGSRPAIYNVKVPDVGRFFTLLKCYFIEIGKTISEPSVKAYAYNLDWDGGGQFLEGDERSPIKEVIPSSCLDEKTMIVYTNKSESDDKITLRAKGSINIRNIYSRMPPLEFQRWEIVEYSNGSIIISSKQNRDLIIEKGTIGHVIALYETGDVYPDNREEDDLDELPFRLPIPRGYAKSLIPAVESLLDKLRNIE